MGNITFRINNKTHTLQLYLIEGVNMKEETRQKEYPEAELNLESLPSDLLFNIPTEVLEMIMSFLLVLDILDL